jgi:C-terminal processing protease CtpA/Prc
MGGSNSSSAAKDGDVRLCQIIAWPNYSGFGFDLRESQQPPQTVKIVHSNSPAAAAGLKIADVILTVNKKDVSEYDRKQVLEAINKGGKKSVELLVVEERYYENNSSKTIAQYKKDATKVKGPKKQPPDYATSVDKQLRTCEISLNETDVGFGFDLVAAENGTGAYIRDVAPNMPASRAKLRKSDRIIEINEQFVDDTPFDDIQSLVEDADEDGYIKLLVASTDAYAYLNENNIPLKSIDDGRRSGGETTRGK